MRAPDFAKAKSVFACALRKRNAGGISDMAVRKAIASGRISVEEDGMIDPDKADRAWGSSSDPAQVRPVAKSPPRGTPRPVPMAAVEAGSDSLRDSGEPAPAAGNMTFVQARTANEVIKAQERRIRLGKLKGDLVDRARAVATVFALARRERLPCVQWPAGSASLQLPTPHRSNRSNNATCSGHTCPGWQTST